MGFLFWRLLPVFQAFQGKWIRCVLLPQNERNISISPLQKMDAWSRWIFPFKKNGPLIFKGTKIRGHFRTRDFREIFGGVTRLSSTCGINALHSSLLGHKMGDVMMMMMCDAMRDLGTKKKKRDFFCFVGSFFHIFETTLGKFWKFTISGVFYRFLNFLNPTHTGKHGSFWHGPSDVCFILTFSSWWSAGINDHRVLLCIAQRFICTKVIQDTHSFGWNDVWCNCWFSVLFFPSINWFGCLWIVHLFCERE